jgi:hypothetical protein
MIAKSALLKICLGIVAGALALALFLFWLADPLQLRSPRDMELIAIFREHRASFERLRQMATEDVRQVTYITEVDIEGNISEARKQEYRRLLSEIYPKLRVSPDYDASVRFVFAGGGLSAISSGWLKGIANVPGNTRKYGDVIQDLDGSRALPSGVYLRQIDSRWFLVYQQIDN